MNVERDNQCVWAGAPSGHHLSHGGVARSTRIRMCYKKPLDGA